MPPLETRCVVNGPFVENTWLAWCPRAMEGVVIDPGFEPERVIRLAEEEGVRVVQVLATHGHIDHVWGAAAVCRATGAPFRMHPADTYWLDALDRQAAMFGLEPAPGKPVVDEPLAGDGRISFGDVTLHCLHTPGHTPGGICFHDGHGTLFTGDLLFRGSIGRTDFPGGDFPTIVKSIRGTVFGLDPGTAVLAGHGEDTTVGEEKASNPFVGDGASMTDAPGDLPYG